MLIIGANHRTATAARLGDFVRTAEAFRARLGEERQHGGLRAVRELAVLATCNRVEVYVVCEPSGETEVVQTIRSEVFDEPCSRPSGTLLELRGVDAVRHLCRVASGLDSMVVGEHQIAGQVARAFRDLVVPDEGKGDVLAAAAAVARKACRRVRAETDVGRYPASVSSVSVDMAKEELNGLTGRTVLLVGAGKAARLVGKALANSGAASVTVVNRSRGTAKEIADSLGASVAPLSALPSLLATADLVLTATGADEAVVSLAAAQAALKARPSTAGPLLLLDLALPRDVDPAVGDLEGLRLLTLEDVKTRVERHLSLRQDEVGPAEAMVEDVIDDFVRQAARTDVEALITELRRDVETLRLREVERWLRARPEGVHPSREEVDHLTRSIINKLLHDPLMRLRSAPGRNGQGEALFHTARELFGLEASPEATPALSSD